MTAPFASATVGFHRRRGSRSSPCSIVALVSLSAGLARAAPPAAHDAPVPSVSAAAQRRPAAASPSRRALAGAAAVIPGLIVHGTGHHVRGEPRTGNRLLLAEGVGLGLVLGGGATLFATGASRYLVAPAAAVTILGVGLFTTSFFADLYGSVAPDPGASEPSAAAPSSVETEFGYRQIHDPQFSYRHFVVESLTLRADRVRVTPSGWFSTAGDNARYRLEAAWRFAGDVPQRAPARERSSFDLVVGGVHHRYAPVGFTISSAEVAAQGRYDLANVGPTLRGAFVEADLGFAHQLIDYDLPGLDLPSDRESLLLARFGFGFALRGGAAPGSELTVYYDHRHDDYAAGLLATGLGSGAAGHFGSSARWYFGRSLGVRAEAQVGSALLAGASLLLRQ